MSRVQHAGASIPPSEGHEDRRPAPWRPTTRFGFRFAFAYFGLYCVVSHILVYTFPLPNTLPGQGIGTVGPLFNLTSRIGENVLGFGEPLVFTGNSRDTNFFWVQLFVVLVTAVAATIVWSLFDRQRENYAVLHKWFRVFIRFALAAQLFYFGMIKVIPTQFPAPSLLTLAAPAGNLSLQGFLWTSIGVSPAYQIFTGIVEVLAGLLLLAPRTTLLGAVIGFASMAHVFIINMSYDIGVKILSFQLTLMALFLIAPDIHHLSNVFFFKRAAEPSKEPELFQTRRANRIALAAQIAFGLYLLILYAGIGRSFWYAPGGGGSPKSPLYGIWNLEELAVDGEVRAPQLNDYDRQWRRVIFDAPQWIYFQREDDSFVRYGVRIDTAKNAITLRKGRSRTWQSDFQFDRPAHDRLILDGHMDGYRIKMQLRLVEFDTFRMLNSPFRWVRPPDPDTQ